MAKSSSRTSQRTTDPEPKQRPPSDLVYSDDREYQHARMMGLRGWSSDYPARKLKQVMKASFLPAK